MAQAILNVQVNLVSETCCSCGVPFAMPDYLKEQCLQKKSGKMFYCPNGHSQYYLGETDAQKLQRQLDWERSQRQTAELNLEREKRKLKAIETRTKEGVCPCCNRTFSQLSRHMKMKHPEFAVTKK